MVAKIIASYNAIFDRPLFNKLGIVLSSSYLMKFKTNKGTESIRGD